MPTITIAQKLYRNATLTSADVTGDKVRMSISSDTPLLREDFSGERYYEQLDHTPGGLVDDRLKAGIPILANHDRSIVIGRAKGYSNDGHRCSVEATLSKAKDVESWVAKIREGTLCDTSIGFEIIGDATPAGERDGIPIYRFKFRVFEASVVSIPADFTVGVNRNSPPNSQTKTKTLNIRMNTTTDNPDDENNEPENGQRRRMSNEQVLGHAKQIRNWIRSITGDGNDEWARRSEQIGRDSILCGETFSEFLKRAQAAFPRQSFGGGIGDAGSSGPGSSPWEGEFGNNRDYPQHNRSLGQIITADRGFQDFARRQGSPGRRCVIELPVSDIRALSARAQTQTGSGVDRPDQQFGGVMMAGTRQPTIADLFAQGSTTGSSVKYPKETTINQDAAGMTAEGALKPFWDPAIEASDAPVRKAAITTKISDEMLADIPATEGYLNMRLPLLVSLAEDRSLLSGDGVAPAHKGILSQAGLLTQAKGADSAMDAAHKCLTKIRTQGFFEPSAFIFHPTDWEKILLSKASGTGNYFGFSPFFLPFNGETVMVPTLWGKPVIQTVACTPGVGVAGAFTTAGMLYRRQGITIEMTNSSDDDFRRNLISLRAESRSALAIYFGAGFCQLTGL